MSKMGKRMIEAAREAAAWASGQENGALLHEFPDVKTIREKLGLTQSAFAERFGLPLGNVRDWEQGRSVPDAAARMLLKIIQKAPEVVADIAAENDNRPAPTRRRVGEPAT